MFKNHPKALPYLFLTEMWERFGYYLMIGIFSLYMKDHINGGMGFKDEHSDDVFGTFIALVYVTPFLGGMLADRLLGFRRSIIIGGVLMGLGYLLLAIPHNLNTFYLALGIMIVGNGFFKPNISTLLGNLYNEDRYRVLKDEGYNIFYMGINIGALLCNFVAAYLRNTYGWGYAFAAAGVGMFIGVITFAMSMRHVKHADVEPGTQQRDSNTGLGVLISSVFLPAIAVGFAAYQLSTPVFGSHTTDAFIFGCIPIIGFYGWTLWKAAPEHKPRLRALYAIFAVVIVFWAIFKQNGTALTTWAEYYTDRSMPAVMETPAKFMGMVQNLKYKRDTFPVMDAHFRKSYEKVLVDGQEKEKVKFDYATYAPYFKNYGGPLPPEGTELKLISTEIFQSVNPAFVVLLTPLLIPFFAFLRRTRRDPGIPTKIGFGIVISALSTLVTVWAVYACHNGAEKASAWWIIGTYGVITVGELFLSPMGLSMVSKMAPRHLAGLMMGGWQLATAIGNKLSGVLAAMWNGYEDKSKFFMTNFALLAVAALVLFAMVRWLNRIFKEAGVE
jgi:proton-dependent oligopeptide transporter, POT family